MTAPPKDWEALVELMHHAYMDASGGGHPTEWMEAALRAAEAVGWEIQNWRDARTDPPSRREPVIYGRRKGGKWSVGIAYWTVSEKWNPELNSVGAPDGFTHWKSIGWPPQPPESKL